MKQMDKDVVPADLKSAVDLLYEALEPDEIGLTRIDMDGMITMREEEGGYAEVRCGQAKNEVQEQFHPLTVVYEKSSGKLKVVCKNCRHRVISVQVAKDRNG